MEKDFKKFLKELLRTPYHELGLGVKLDESLINDLMQYFSLDRKEIIFYLKNSKKLNADLWKISSPKTEQEIKQFYAFTPYYVFALAYWHMKKYQRNFRRNVLNYVYGDILDYGGGIGDLCLDFLKKGHLSVTYADIGGETFNFAEWLFQKHKASIKLVNLTKEKMQGQYDTIVCIDVIEHILNPKDLIITLNGSLKNKGSLIITNLGFKKEATKQNPMHFGLKFDVKEYLRSLGLVNKDFPWLWIKK